LSPFLTSTSRFYRVDTALVPPTTDLAAWRLRITGMVDHPVELSYRQLLASPLEEAAVTIACVSNEVGDQLVGNARWRGVPLAGLLRRAGVRPGATQLVARSVDGFTVGFPTELALDGRAALVALGMNGQPLPQPHGFPARLIVPGLYGYVSACKWLAELELTTLDAFDAYWVRRGWAKLGPIKTQSRIDTPRDGSRPRPGRVPVAGVAWAPHRGISRVEVQVDSGPWLPARLGAGTADTWRQWLLDWDASPGRHRLRVRATDGSGHTQPATPTPPFPDGATGWHTISVQVRSR
jgi:DMSO/TMAO reductase YedYZ molybdopterin-dependent catalytic subunit